MQIFKCANCNDVPCSMNCRSCLDPFDNQCTGLQHQVVHIFPLLVFMFIMNLDYPLCVGYDKWDYIT